MFFGYRLGYFLCLKYYCGKEFFGFFVKGNSGLLYGRDFDSFVFVGEDFYYLNFLWFNLWVNFVNYWDGWKFVLMFVFDNFVLIDGGLN